MGLWVPRAAARWPPAEKTDRGDLVRVDVQRRRMVPQVGKRGLGVRQGFVQRAVPADGIAQHKGVEAFRQIGQRDGFRLAV